MGEKKEKATIGNVIFAIIAVIFLIGFCSDNPEKKQEKEAEKAKDKAVNQKLAAYLKNNFPEILDIDVRTESSGARMDIWIDENNGDMASTIARQVSEETIRWLRKKGWWHGENSMQGLHPSDMPHPVDQDTFDRLNTMWTADVNVISYLRERPEMICQYGFAWYNAREDRAVWRPFSSLTPKQRDGWRPMRPDNYQPENRPGPNVEIDSKTREGADGKVEWKMPDYVPEAYESPYEPE